MVKEELQATERRLSAASREGYEVCGPEKPMPIDGAEDFEVALREDDSAYRSAFEPGSAGLELGH